MDGGSAAVGAGQTRPPSSNFAPHRTTSHPSSVTTTPTRCKPIPRRRRHFASALNRPNPALPPIVEAQLQPSPIKSRCPHPGRPALDWPATSHIPPLSACCSHSQRASRQHQKKHQKQLGMSSRDSGTAMHLWEAAHASASVCTCRPAICHLLIRLLVPPTSSPCLR